jgi:3-isopropylmalate/(R)-2-methylmalate dehydratase small subunit
LRNCVNMGLLLPIVSDHPFDASVIGKDVSVDLDKRIYVVDGKSYDFPGFGPVGDIIAAGGLTNYNKARSARGLT